MKQIKKMAALVLAAAMAGSLMTGCGASGNTEAGPELDDALAGEDFTYPMSGDHSLSYWCELSVNVSANFPSLNDTEFAKGLMEHTGATITFQHPPTGGTDEQFNLIIADGELPDLLEYKWQNYPGGPQKAIDDGYIYALNDIIDQYCPNLKAYLAAHPEVDRQCKTDEGNYYAFPFIRGDDKLRVTQGLMIRQDWLDELGLDIPTTIDDWHTVLTAFKEEKGAAAPFSYEYTTSLLYENEAFVYAYNTARVLDWAYSEEGHLFYNFGVEGESYTMENGVPTYTDFVMHNPDGWGITQAMAKYTRCSYNGPFVQDLGYLEQYYTLDGQIKAVDVWKSSEAAEHILPPITPTSEESTEFSAIVNEMTTYRNEMTLKFILGTESLDNFDKYVATLNQMGLERALEIENAALERYNQR